MANQDADQRRRRFLTAATSVVGAVGVGFVAVPFVSSWQPSARAKAVGAPIEVDISKVEPGQLLIEKWRGKPVWILRRTESQLATLNRVESRLRDPNSEVTSQQPPYAQNEYRSIKPELLVVVGICTHLGCSPQYLRSDEGGAHGLGEEWAGGFFCPCHGSRFDISGRVFQGVPAPTNLEVPPYRYVSENLIEVGLDPREA